MKLLNTVILALFLSQTSLAAEAKKVTAKEEKVTILADDSLSKLAPGFDEAVAFDTQWNEEHPKSEYETLAKTHAKTPVRAPAANENVGGSADLAKIRTTLYQQKTGDQFNDFIEKTLKPNYNSYADDAKLLANQLIEFSALRGLIFKMVPLIDKQKMAHSYLLTWVMRFADSISIHFPEPQWVAAFEFLVQPYDGIVRFNTIQDLQRFIGTTLYKAVAESDIRLRRLAIDEKGLVWDNSVFGSSKSYPDAFDRYTRIQEAERYTLLAAKQRAMARMKFFCAYNFDDMFAISNNFAKMRTQEAVESRVRDFMSGQADSSIQGVSAQESVAKLKDSRYPNFGHLWKNGGTYVKQSLRHYQRMVSDLDQAWSALDKKKTETNRAVINRGVAEVFDRRVSHILPTWKDMMAQTSPGQTAGATVTSHPVTLTSHLEGDEKSPAKVTVDLIAFFNNPPTNLKSLLPVKFAPNGQDAVWIKKGKYRYHNYLRGSGTAWSNSAYSTLFPDLKNDRAPASDKVKTYDRILSQSWGGQFIAGPLSTFVF